MSLAASGGRLHVAPGTGWVDDGDAVYPALLPDGPPLVLAGSGAVVWRAVVPGGTADEVVARVAEATGTSAQALAPDVLAFVDSLVAAGLVTRE